MEEDNTTPEPNVPEENESGNGLNQNPESESEKKDAELYQTFKNKKFGKNYWEKQYEDHEYWKRKPEPTISPKSNVYDEIVEDLIDIIAKLLKELSKKK